jgi:cysteine desulfuration protein SufE
MCTETLKFKISRLEEAFKNAPTQEERYALLIQMGKDLPPLPASFRTPENLVPGCQSLLYLKTTFEDGKLYFHPASDALISAGLAALLSNVYSGETPETILRHSPDFLNHLGIHASLSPNRSNGLSQIHLKMKQAALKFLLLSPKILT